MKANKAFQDVLTERIHKLRPMFKPNDRQLKGRNFNSDMWAYESTVGAVLVRINDRKDLMSTHYADGLDLDEKMVNSGKFDPLINFILSQLATIDFDIENSLAFN